MGLDLPYPLKNPLEFFTKNGIAGGLQMNRLTIAHDFVTEQHRGEKRKFTNNPYMMHLEETAQLLWEATNGEASDDEYIAALCHDVVENTSTTLEEIGKNFGGTVMELVGEVTNDEAQISIHGKTVHLSKKINAMSNKAFLIKLCDRLSNVIGLQENIIPNQFVDYYIKETQYIIENLDRKMDAAQEHLIDRISKMLLFLKLKRDL
jgi:(p)ppGpp synthase/HD superfamily hydrolase